MIYAAAMMLPIAARFCCAFFGHFSSYAAFFVAAAFAFAIRRFDAADDASDISSMPRASLLLTLLIDVCFIYYDALFSPPCRPYAMLILLTPRHLRHAFHAFAAVTPFCDAAEFFATI